MTNEIKVNISLAALIAKVVQELISAAVLHGKAAPLHALDDIALDLTCHVDKDCDWVASALELPYWEHAFELPRVIDKKAKTDKDCKVDVVSTKIERCCHLCHRPHKLVAITITSCALMCFAFLIFM